MHNALIGALIGAAVGILFYWTDYMMLRSHAAERAKKLHRPAAFDDTERKRLRALVMFCLCMPPAFAFAFWIFG